MESIPTLALFGLEDEKLARLVFLICLLVFVAGGLKFSTRHLGKTIRQAATWLVIIAALVVLYAYRDPVQRVFQPVISELQPSRATMIVDADGRDTLVFSRSRDGHFHVRATINGAEVAFLVDTGATRTVLTQRDAERSGIPVDSLQYNRPVQTANGVTYEARLQTPSIKIGPVTILNPSVGVLKAGQLETSLLGMNVLDQFTSLRVEGDRLYLSFSSS